MTKYTRAFVVNSAVASSTSFLLRTAAVIFSAYTARRIGSEGMGLYTLVMTVYGFAVTLSTSGIHLAVTRLVSEQSDRQHHPSVMTAAFWYCLFFGALSTALLTLGAPLIGIMLGDSRTVPAVRMLGLSMIPIALSTSMNGFFIATGKVWKNSVTQIFEQLCRIFLITLMISRALPRGVEHTCIAMVAGSALSEVLSFLMLFAFYVRDTYRLGTEQGGPAPMRDIFTISLPIAFSSYVRSGLLTLEHSLIPRSIARGGVPLSSALSEYGMLQGMAMPIVMYPTSLLFPVSGLLVPEFARRRLTRSTEHLRGLLYRTLSLCLSFGIACTLVLVMLSSELGALIYGTSQVGSYIFPLAFVIPLMFCDNAVDNMLRGLGQQVFCMWVNIIDSVVSILMVMVLLPSMGAMGYVWVILIAELLNLTAGFVRITMLIGMPRGLVRAVLRPAAAALLSYRVTCSIIMSPGQTCVILPMLLRLVCSVSFYILLMLVRLPKIKKPQKAISTSPLHILKQ